MKSTLATDSGTLKCVPCTSHLLIAATVAIFWVAPEVAQAQIFVTSLGGTAISDYHLDGTLINASLISGLSGTSGIAVDGSNLFVLDGDKIGEYTTSGAVVNSSLITGLENGPIGIAMSGSDLFVANIGDGNYTGTIGKYTTSGTTINSALITGLNTPIGIAVSGENLFVTIGDDCTVGKYTTAGATVSPALISGFFTPTGIAISGGNLFVADQSGYIGKYNLDGTPVNPTLISGPYNPWGIAVSGSNLFVASLGDGTIGKYTTSGTTVKASLISGLHEPFGIAVVPEPPPPPPPSLPPGKPIVDINPSTQVPAQYNGFNEGHGNGMVGYLFALRQAVTITQVGWYDDGQDGLSRDFQVGLWSPDGQQLLGDPSTGIVIPAGTEASLNGVWRVVDLPIPLHLEAGGYYTLGGLDTATTPDVIKFVMDSWAFEQAFNSSSSTVIPGEFFYAFPWSSPTFHNPSPNELYAAGGLELGPMLFMPVPEPSTLVMVSVGIVCLLTCRTASSAFKVRQH